MRKICLIMSIFLVTACMTEVKPLLKHSEEVSIPDRIASQQKWLDQDIASRAYTRQDALPVREKLDQIKGQYNRLQSTGALTANDSEAINRMLDQTSDWIFRLKQKKRAKGAREL